MTEKGVGGSRERQGAQVHQDIDAHLVVRLDGQAVTMVQVRDGLRLGRAQDNDVVLPGTRGARYHVRIDRQGDHYFLSNVGSKEHTWVNGISLIGQRRLRPGDRIVLGDVELVFGSGPPRLESATDNHGQPGRASKSAMAGGSLSGAEASIADKTRGRRRAYNLTPAGVVVLLASLAMAAYFLIPGLFQPQTTTPQPTPTATEVAFTASAVPTQPRPATPVAAATSSSSPEDTQDRLAEAEVLTLKSRFEEAIAIYQEMVREHPDDPLPEIGWAWALLLDALPDQALLHARRAGQLAPESAAACTVLARAYADVEETDSALSWAQRAVASDSGSAEAYAALALALLVNDSASEAVEQAEAALQKDPGSAEAHRVRGRLYQDVENDPQQAALELQAAAELQPELWLRHHELGLALLQVPHYEEAILALTNALVLRHKAATYTALGRTYYQMGQPDQAKSFLEQSLSAGAWDADTYGLLAALNAQQMRCEDARVYYEQALMQDPEHRLAREAKSACGAAPSTPSTAATATAGGAAATATAEPPLTLTGQIAFPVWNRDAGHYDTYLAQVDGSNRQLVVEQMHQPALRPDGQWLAVNSERAQQMNLCIVRPDGRDLQQVSRYIEDSRPAWSPNGQGLVLDSTRHPDRRSRVYIIEPVPYDGTQAEGRVLRSDLYEVLGTRPTWTAEGSIIYSGCDYTRTPARCGLFRLSSEPGPHTPEPLTDEASDTAPAVHGRQLAYMSMRDGNWEIYVLDMGASEPARLTRNTANDGLPVWSPDGQTLAFVSDQGGIWAVWAMNADGSQRQKLFDLGGGGLAFDWQEESISWAP